MTSSSGGESGARLVVRPPLEHELDAFADCVENAFSMRFGEGERDRFIAGIDCSRSLATFVEDELVATLSSHVVELTLPGPRQHPAVVITEVAVQPTHRRQGALSAMVSRHLCDLHEEGQAIALLSASDGSIYGRFGFGAATFGATYTVKDRANIVQAPTGKVGGRVKVLSAREAREILPVVFSAERVTRPGEIDRPAEWWDEITDYAGSDGVTRFFVSYAQETETTGYVVYDVVLSSSELRELVVVETCYLTPDARRGLWSYLLHVDLVQVVRSRQIALDEALPLLFVDPRAVATRTVADRTWLRLIDAQLALSVREYNGSGRVVIFVSDEQCPWNQGSLELLVRDGKAEVAPTRDDADLECGAGELAMIYLGATRPSALVEARRIFERSPGTAKVADTLFAVARPPFCTALG